MLNSKRFFEKKHMARPKANSLEEAFAALRRAGRSPAEIAALDKILSARTAAGLTQAQVAEKMQTTQSLIARIERDLARGKYPTLTTLEKYALAVGKKLELRFMPVKQD